MNLEDTIDKAYIERARKGGACHDALSWLVAPHTYKELLGAHLDWYCWGIERLDVTASRYLPTTVGGSLDLNGLTSAEGLVLPTTVGGYLYLRDRVRQKLKVTK